MIPALIIAIALWIGFIYFMASPWLAGLHAALTAVLGWAIHVSASRVKVQVEDAESLADLLSLEEAWKCKGRVPLDGHYDAVDREVG